MAKKSSSTSRQITVKAKKPSPKKAPNKALSKRAAPPKSKPTKTKSAKFIPWTEAEVVEAFTRFRNANPEPKGELEHINPYTLLVAVALSAQATDVGVNKATRHLFPVADTPEKMVALGEDKLRDYIKTIGLYRTKAKNVIALSKMLIDEHNSGVPRSREALEKLPGVGRKDRECRFEYRLR